MAKNKIFTLSLLLIFICNVGVYAADPAAVGKKEVKLKKIVKPVVKQVPPKAAPKKSVAVKKQLPVEEIKDEKIVAISAGASKIIKLGFMIRNIAIGDAEIADVLIVSKYKVLINAKKAGITTLTLWNSANSYEYNIVVHKSAEDYVFKNYKLDNIKLIKTEIDDPSNYSLVKREPVKRTVEDIENILGSYLESYQFSVSPWTSSIMVVCSKEDHKKVAELIEKIDSREKQVLMKVEVYELKEEDSLLSEIQAVNQAGEGTLEYNKGTDGLKYTFSSGSNFANLTTGLLKTLEAEGKATILANPKILTLAGRYSVIHAGERIPLVHTDAQGNPTVEYLYTGVILGVVPIVSKENINCWVSTQVSSISGYSPQNGYPNLTTRETINEVRLPDKGILVLGGLINETENVNTNKIPILGDLLGWIPIIGNFVMNEESSKTKTELVITLRPEILFDEDVQLGGVVK